MFLSVASTEGRVDSHFKMMKRKQTWKESDRVREKYDKQEDRRLGFVCAISLFGV